MLPGVVAPPRASAEWEREISPDQLVAAATIADDAGYSHVGCGDHVAVPRTIAEIDGGTFWDPLATLSYVAASTVSIRLLTQVLTLGHHHPLAIAKRYGTLDRLSGGRVVLGVGVKGYEPEFTLLGASYARRGARADDALRAIRASWGRRYPSYVGPFYAFDEVEVSPSALRDKIAIWVSGRSKRALRRALQYGDGWMPTPRPLAEFAQLLARIERPADFEIVLPVVGFLDPVGDPVRTKRALDEVRDAGATVGSVTFVAPSFAAWCEQVEALAQYGPAWGVTFGGDPTRPDLRSV